MFLKTTYDSYQYSDYFKTDLPQHWTEKRLGYLAKEERAAFVDGPFGSDLKTSDYMDDGVPLIQLNNIRDSKHLMQNMKFVTEEKKNQLIRHLAIAGDVVIAKMAEPVARAAIVGSNYSEYVIVADCVKMTANLDLVDLRYLVWAINSDYVRINAELVSTGTTRIRVNLGELKKLKIPYPTYIEQQKIANFLDHETAKIDTLIEKQRRLIELLKEKRQAVISHAVTKGLNPNAPMKDSGVEWLGEVPEHWVIKPIKQLVELNPKKSEILNKSLTCNFVPMEKLKIGTVLLDEIRIISDVYDGYTYFKNGDILMAKVTPCFENHNIAIVGELENNIGFGSTEIYVLRVKTDVIDNFLFYRLQESNFIAIGTSAMTGAGGLKRVPSDVLNNYLLAIPNLEEQEKIASYIDTQTTKIDDLVDKANAAIELMQERRTALISAAVTGKIDVRLWNTPNA